MAPRAHASQRKDYPIHVRTAHGVDKTAVGTVLKHAFKRAWQIIDAGDDPSHNFPHYMAQIKRAVLPSLKRDHPHWFERREGDVLDAATGDVATSLAVELRRRGVHVKSPVGIILLNVGMYRDAGGTKARTQVCLTATHNGFRMLGHARDVPASGQLECERTAGTRLARLEEDMRRRALQRHDDDALYVLASLAGTAERGVPRAGQM